MAAPSTDIKDLLVTAGIGTFGSDTGWSIAISNEPTSPDQVVTIYDTGGDVSNPKWLLDHPSMQVRIRGTVADYPGTWIKAQAVKDAMLGLQKQTINSTIYIGIWQITDILSLGYDDNNRPILVTNWRITREPASGTNRTSL